MFSKSVNLAQYDPDLAAAIAQEDQRQQDHVELIASENYVSCAVMEAQGSQLTNKYAEGYPGKRYYGGCEYVDIVEQLAIDRVKELFGAEYANVQPHSGSQANQAVYASVLKPGDTILGMSLAHGGHLTHGASVNISGKLYNAITYGLDENEVLDYAEVERLALEHKPKMIVAGASRECELAIVAGVFVTSPRFQALAAEAGLLSTSGRCRPFREDADGMVLGDGVGVLVLKPLPSALADGDHVYAIVRASAMSHNGRAPSIMAPVTRSMRDMIVKLYRDSETDVHSVRLLEAQGTGSPVSDSAELSALTAALTELGAAPHSCVLGSTKSVLGHAVAASGMAAVAKVLASFRRGEVPGWVGGEADHRHLSSHDSPFVLGATPTRLASDGELPTRAGVNAYAFNGTNVHAILEQFKPARRSIGRERSQLVPVSGRTDEALRGNLAALAEWLATHDAALGDVAYTLQVGRQHHARRRAFVVDDCRTLRLQIEQALSRRAGWSHSGRAVTAGWMANDRGAVTQAVPTSRRTS